MIQIKRTYEASSPRDGYRVLVDRLWPRGIKKADLALDEWAKDLAPSTELRKRFGHDVSKWKEFQHDYKEELRARERKDALDALVQRARKGTVTLLFSAKDEEHNGAVVLKNVLEKKLKA